MNLSTSRTEKAPVIALALFLFFSLSITQRAVAQNDKLGEIHVSIDVKEKPFREVLALLESQMPYRFAYSTDLVLQQKLLTVTVTNVLLTDLLADLLKGTPLTYAFIGGQIVLQNSVPPPKITFSGYVKDARTGELLIGASIYFPGLNAGTVSNGYGFYSITLPPVDSVAIEVSYVGYKSLTRQVRTGTDLSLTFDLDHNQQQESIRNVTIGNDKREDNVKKNQAALVDLSDDMLMTAPSLSGGGDVVNSIQMLPGVQAEMDGTPGYSVRGGNTGQNLILLDEATLYNPSHVFGLVSIFNGPAIKNANLMKGGFPASYGDHISSVLDIAMKDGSRQRYGGALLLSPIASGITLYGPLQPEKSSFLVAARRSAIDWWLSPFARNNYFSNYYFYDLNAKASYWLSHKDRLLFSFYKGLDKNAYYTDATDSSGIDYAMHFGNQVFALRWNHLFSGKLFANTSVIYNRYHQLLSATESGYFAQLYSGIRDMNIKTDLSYYPSPGDKISAGLNYLYQTLYPASVSAGVSPTDSSLFIDPGAVPEKSATRMAAYVSDEMKLGDRLDLYAGVRAPYYYKPGVQYLFIEPRLSVLYLLGPSTSLKASYTQMHQYIHLVQSYNAAFPAEIWIGSSPFVQPQSSHEISAGLYKNFEENAFQASLEGYYKYMGNQMLFKGGTTPTIDNNMEDQLIFGKGWSYGAELLVRKNRGRLKGWLAYTYAYAWQQFDSLNFGDKFPFAFDRRHSLYVAAAYELDAHWKLSADFFMASGRAFTLATTIDSSASGFNSNPLYDDETDNGGTTTSTTLPENNYRLSPYNRLDLGISYKRRRATRHGFLEAEWILSVYNVYAHRNASFAYRAIDPVTKQVSAREVSVIPVIPTLTYSLRF